MKRILSALVLVLAASHEAFAGNGYCDSRRSNREIESCYKNVIEVNASQIKQNYQSLLQSPKLTQQQKQQLQQDQSAWIEKLDRYCKNDMRCISDEAAKRNYFLAGQVRNN
jgi:uncharacterized protein YecT (DUF1311 family)